MKLVTVICTLLIAWAAAGVARGDQARHWEFAGWYGGGCYPDVTFDPRNRGRVYLASDVAGAWRSDDLGEHWTFMTRGLGQLSVAQIAVAPSDANTLYAATGQGVYVSRDAGGVWAGADNLKGRIRFTRPSNYRSIAVHPQDAAHICAGTAGGNVFCSQDRGTAWEDLDSAEQFFKSGKPVTAVLFSADGGTLYAAGADGVFRFDRQARQWKGSPTSPRHVTDMAISVQRPGVLYAADGSDLWVSSDNGDSWTRSRGDHSGGIYRLALREKDKRTEVFALANQEWNGTVIVSDNDGEGWLKLVTGVAPDIGRDPTWSWANTRGKGNALKIDPFDSRVMFRTDWWGVWRSDDGGRTWNEKINGAPDTVATDILVNADSIVVSSMDNGLLKSDDSGATYQMLFPDKAYDINKCGHVWRLARADDHTLIGTSSPWGRAVNQVIISHDNGKTFTRVSKGLSEERPKKNTMWGEGYPRALAVDSGDPRHVYLGIDGDDGGGLYLSVDGGASWSRSQGQPGSRRVYRGLAVDPTDPDRLFWGACGAGGGVYVSNDRGLTWVYALKQSQWIFDLRVATDGVVYAAGDSNGPAVFISRDHGRTWSAPVKFGDKGAAGAVAVDPNDPAHVAVSTVSWVNEAPQKIYVTDDGGRHWQEGNGDLPDGAGAAALAFSTGGEYLYAARYAGSVWRCKLK